MSKQKPPSTAGGTVAKLRFIGAWLPICAAIGGTLRALGGPQDVSIAVPAAVLIAAFASFWISQARKMSNEPPVAGRPHQKASKTPERPRAAAAG
jgi:hypothetical protein